MIDNDGFFKSFEEPVSDFKKIRVSFEMLLPKNENNQI